ncbi:sensor histidine kinase [Corynebacterium doosanense]|uniref:ATPase n=1 Tax=Corynebacterium doosanense CAU 212 = DSM 45436 TaxID=558173 RepID=A0A097IIT2_9CORY|nr:sensor histidine kinase [Corynebacterium doosanense]AIT62046.1 ATPase [Corynebacterium doosanense CAU 212 = DSM 45436]
MSSSLRLPGSPLPDEDALRGGIHIFTAVLLMVAVATSFQMSLLDAALNLVLITIFAAAYFLGSIYVDAWSEGKRQAWVLLLTVVWISEMIVAPVGIYLVFTLYFLYLQVFDSLQGGVSVVFATAAAIIVQIPGGLTFGGVMGPAVSAVISLAIHYAFRTLARISDEREQLINQLMDTREKLAESEHAAGVVAERQRLAHELHDTVAQGLSSIQMLLHAAERDVFEGPERTTQAVERIRQARSAASENLAEARAMITALQPAPLAENSLRGALERMAGSFGAAGEIDIAVDVEGEQRPLPMGTEATLLRIAQGAVGNVVKHSGASRCRVTVTYEADEVRLDVVDNGRGFDPEVISAERAGLGHIGLSAMSGRASERGGTLVIESAPGGPTAVSVAIPDARRA